MDGNNHKRLIYLDNLKGFLIILVVLGHCIQSFDPEFDNNYIFKFIYGFHMPLFIFVSGFVSYTNIVTIKKLGKRAVQLLVPFFTWGILGMFLNGEFGYYWIVRPDGGLWFLWTLFFIIAIHTLFTQIANRYKLKDNILLGVVSLLLITILFKTKLAFGFHLIAWYLPFYLLGWYTRQYELMKKSEFTINAKLLFVMSVMLCLYFISIIYWNRNGNPSFLSEDKSIIKLAVGFIYKFGVGILGCYIFLILSKIFNGKILMISNLGGATLGVYAIHQPIIRMIKKIGEGINFNLSLTILILIVFVLTSVVTYIIYKVLRMTSLTSILFLGEKNRSKQQSKTKQLSVNT